jgi:DNA modification methylase
MNSATVASEVDLDPVVQAISNAGITGITAKQLSAVTSLPIENVTHRIDVLSAEKEIHRIGRGLWVLDRFATLGPSQEAFRASDWYDPNFEKEFGVKIGARAGEIQFNPNEKRTVHRWWPYVQGFSAGFVDETCRRFGIGDESTVLDPFCGSGTVPVAARLIGAKGIGIDMMPIAAFVARAKGEWGVDPKRLFRAAQKVTEDRSPLILSKPFLKETDRQFSPDILHTLLCLKQNIWAVKEGPTKTLLKLAFASILIDSSNLKRAPCLGYTKKLGLSADTPIRLFLEGVHRISGDLATLQSRRAGWGPKLEIHLGNAALVRLPEASVDLAITSPPYVNGMDYVMNYKIDLAWMDFIDSYERLAELRASMVACDNIPRGTAAAHRPSQSVLADDWLTYISTSVQGNVLAKGSYRRDDMGAIVTKYFDDLVPVIQNVYAALKPGGRFVIVNGDSLMAGTYIPGDMLFARLASRIGFIVEGFEVARTRRSGQRRGFMLRESIATLRKPGPYRAPRQQRFGQALEDFDPPN